MKRKHPLGRFLDSTDWVTVSLMKPNIRPKRPGRGFIRTRYRRRYVSWLTHDVTSENPYGCRMRDETDDPGSEGGTFATWVRSARLAAGLTQDQILAQAEVMVERDDGPELSKSTLNRWEGGKTVTARPDNIRLFCAITGADPREAVIALGYVTRDELGMPPAPPVTDPVLADAAKLFANDDVSPAAKDNLRSLIRAAVGFTYENLGLRRPKKAEGTVVRTVRTGRDS